jgi:ribonuclease P protein component
VKREQRLRAPADFRRVRDVARRGLPHALLIMFVAPNELGRTRVGITVSGRVGNAVVRNRVRRRLREAIGLRFGRLPVESDVVFAARPASAQATWDQLCAALDLVLARAENSR